VRDFDFEGKKALWDIFVLVKDPKVLEAVSSLLVILHTSFVSSAAKMEQIQ
jgi:hypothetical protein